MSINTSRGFSMLKYSVIAFVSWLCYVCPGSAAALEEFVCKTSKHTVIVDLQPSGEWRYRSWNKPKDTHEKPDRLVLGGEETVEGTGPCRYATWSFSNGNVEYVVNTLGCTETIPPAGTVGELSVYIDGDLKKTWWCSE
jgi:hypothetical protein